MRKYIVMAAFSLCPAMAAARPADTLKPAKKRFCSQLSAGAGFFSPAMLRDLADENVIYRERTATFNITYRYYLHERFALGITVATEHLAGHQQGGYRVRGLTAGRDASYTRNTLTVAAEALLEYDKLANGGRIYGFVGAGAGNVKRSQPGETDTTYYELAWHLCPVGMSVGRRLFAGVELGYGYKGIINFSTGYRF